MRNSAKSLSTGDVSAGAARTFAACLGGAGSPLEKAVSAIWSELPDVDEQDAVSVPGEAEGA